ncbi:nucleotide exchange factor GrpE, partial [Chloroflexota bacterium]
EETEISEIKDIDILKQVLEEEKAKVEANLVGWQRAQADFANYKRRNEHEKEEIGKFANTVFVLALIPVLDDLERAIESIPDSLAEHSWTEGVRLIERKLRAGLEAQGLSQIKTLNEPFDPNFHEAVMQATGKEGIIVQEIQKGYQLHNRVIRPSMVVVGSGEGKEEGKKEE